MLAKNINRKDAAPIETINKIRRILKELKIEVNELYDINNNGQWFSVRIEVKGLLGSGVNGKGISEEYALASAYGELMERIQSRFLVRPTYSVFGYDDYTFWDEIEIDSIDSYNRFKEYFVNFVDKKDSNMLIRAMNSNRLFRRCIPFYSLTEDRLEYFPYKLVNICCGTNGLCAGNTKEEAILQGICENAERFIHQKIFKSKLRLFDIDIRDTFAPETIDLIAPLKTNGYNIEIKKYMFLDILPVVLLLVLNKEKTRYKITVGCDPDINIALQRCITEMFQGVIFDSSFEKRMNKINWDTLTNFCKFSENEWLKATINNTGHHPICAFERQCNREKAIYKQRICNNKEYLKLIIDHLKLKGVEVWVRDFSYLGFPTYRVYLPGISECIKITRPMLKYYCNEYEYNKTIFNLKAASTNSLRKLKNIMKELINSPLYEFYGFFKIWGHMIFDKEEVDWDSNVILFLICIRLQQKKEALKYLNKYIDNEEDKFNNVEYLQSLRSFLLSKKRNVTANSLSSIDYINRIKTAFFDNQLINDFSISACPNCPMCDIKSCGYNRWKYINNILKEKEEEKHIIQDAIC